MCQVGTCHVASVAGIARGTAYMSRPGCVTPLRSATEMQQCVGWRRGDLVSGCVTVYMSVEFVFGDLGSDNQI